MATEYGYSAYDRIIGRIWQVRERRRALYITEGMLLVVTAALGLIVVFGLADGFIHFPRPFRLATFFTLLSILLFGSIFLYSGASSPKPAMR